MWKLIHHPLSLLLSPSPSSDRGPPPGSKSPSSVLPKPPPPSPRPLPASLKRQNPSEVELPPAMTSSVLTCNLGFHSLPSFRCRRRCLPTQSLLPRTPAFPFRQSSTLPSFPSAPPKPFPAGLTPTSNHGRRSPIPVVRASASASAAPAAAPAPWQGAALKPLAASIATGVILWLVPAPSGVSGNAWKLLAIFLATIVGIITQPLPLGAVALLGLGASVLTKTLTFAAAFSAFGDPIPWLIALAFFFARGFIKTGLGNRVAYQFVSLFGSSSLGLGYSLVFSEALLAPAIPSVSARAGGIFLPLVKALCTACGSNVGDGTENRLGSWLMLTCFQTSVISSSMFLTAMAANPLSANLTQNTINQTIGWTDWAVAAFVPGLVSLVVVPLLLYLIYPPTVKSSPDAPKLAKEKLQKMGPMTKNEIIMAVTLFLTVNFVGGLGLSWQLSFGILVLLYFYSHYFFASGAAHIGAMFTAFLSVASALGTPPLFAAMVLSFFSNLMGGLTHYGIGSAPVFYGANYVPLPKWWGYGFIVSVVNIIIWLGIGGFWWKTIGLW
ncbi:hypothetical protein BHE74_00004888 [Ensete ventricosum]|nr:hypothetical protein BHE74_00004888 [Ensete ventricosum]